MSPPASEKFLPLLTTWSREEGVASAHIRGHTLPPVQAGARAHSCVTCTTQPAIRAAADSWGHTVAPIPAALWTDRFLTFRSSPAGGADTFYNSIHCEAVPTIPTAPITNHFMAIFSPESWRASTFPRAKALSSILTLGITVSILAELSLVALGAETGVVSDTDSGVFAWWVTNCIEIKHERDDHPAGCL